MPKVEGPCHICGRVRELSYEHVPPESAFNSNRVWVARGDLLFKGLPAALANAKQQQRGAGGYTRSGECNNDTGRYSRAYAEWATQAIELLLKVPGQIDLAYPFRIFPLRVMKQII